MPVFDEKQEELEHYETMMGIPRGRLAVTMDMITDAMALVGQHGVYCQSQRWPGKPVMDIQLIMKGLTDAKELIQSVMAELNKRRKKTPGYILHSLPLPGERPASDQKISPSVPDIPWSQATESGTRRHAAGLEHHQLRIVARPE